jgi:hypothetical protein
VQGDTWIPLPGSKSKTQKDAEWAAQHPPEPDTSDDAAQEKHIVVPETPGEREKRLEEVRAVVGEEDWPLFLKNYPDADAEKARTVIDSWLEVGLAKAEFNNEGDSLTEGHTTSASSPGSSNGITSSSDGCDDDDEHSTSLHSKDGVNSEGDVGNGQVNSGNEGLSNNLAPPDSGEKGPANCELDVADNISGAHGGEQQKADQQSVPEAELPSGGIEAEPKFCREPIKTRHSKPLSGSYKQRKKARKTDLTI